MKNNCRSAFFLKLCLLILILSAPKTLSAQKPFPDFPPQDVASQMDRDQMLWQLGIKLPVLPLKQDDPNRPAGAFPSDKNNPEGNWTNDKKYTITRSAFGLWNNYSDNSSGFFPGPDSSRLGSYTPINLLQMNDGRIITTPEEWRELRRPEILKDLKEQLYGFIPPDSILPKVSWSVVNTSGGRGSSAYLQKEITGTIDISRYPQVRNRPVISATLRIPAGATGQVPVIIFFGGFGNAIETYWERSNPSGWGICIFNLTALQPDNGTGLTSYLIGLVNKGNWRKPSDWGTLVAWSWGVSRLIDYFETDKSVNAGIIGLTGHSRYGKATLVTMAYEPRVAIGFPSDGGSLGTKMNRRHWGQDLENSTGANEYHWMAGAFFKWAGEKTEGQYLPRKIEDCPVDAHSLLALCAPRPLLFNGGTNSSWCDPYGQYLTTKYATPVYKLLGKEGVVMDDPRPVIDKAYIDGNLAFRYHNGGHTDAPEWPAFFQFASRHFDIPVLTASVATITIEAEKDLLTYFTVASNREWKVKSSKLWLKPDKKTAAGNDTIMLKIKPNKKEARTALVTITAEGRSQKVVVNQASSLPLLSISEKEIRIGEKTSSEAAFEISSNTAWNLSSGAQWLTVNEEAGINNKTITLTAAANQRVQERTSTLKIISPGLPVETITVTQAAGLPVMSVSQESILIPAAGGASSPLIITSNAPWLLKCSQQWLTANADSGDGFKQIVFTALENTGSSERKAQATLTVAGMPPKIINIIQKGK
jgi:hypothetical protein